MLGVRFGTTKARKVQIQVFLILLHCCVAVRFGTEILGGNAGMLTCDTRKCTQLYVHPSTRHLAAYAKGPKGNGQLEVRCYRIR